MFCGEKLQEFCSVIGMPMSDNEYSHTLFRAPLENVWKHQLVQNGTARAIALQPWPIFSGSQFVFRPISWH